MELTPVTLTAHVVIADSFTDSAALGFSELMVAELAFIDS